MNNVPHYHLCPSGTYNHHLCSVAMVFPDPKPEARWIDYKEGRISFWRDFIFELDLKYKTNKEKQ